MSQTSPYHQGNHLVPNERDRSSRVKSLPLIEWPKADQSAWAVACRPTERLKRGGAASHMKAVTQEVLAKRYGSFLDHVRRSEGLDLAAVAAGYVTPDKVQRFLAEIKGRVSSVTAYISIHKLRRIAQLLAPGQDFTWLTEIEKDLAFVMQPRSKFDRLVYSEVLVEAGLTLMAEADAATHRSALVRAGQFRDGLMVALLAVCPIRLQNFASLEIGNSFVQIKQSWWIVLGSTETKERRADERPVPAFLTRSIERYLNIYRPVLARNRDVPESLWLSITYGDTLSYWAVQQVIGRVTLSAVGIQLGPHMFRTCAASTAATHAGNTPHLATALLHHTDPAVTEEHYNRASSLTAAQTYAALIKTLRDSD